MRRLDELWAEHQEAERAAANAVRIYVAFVDSDTPLTADAIEGARLDVIAAGRVLRAATDAYIAELDLGRAVERTVPQ